MGWENTPATQDHCQGVAAMSCSRPTLGLCSLPLVFFLLFFPLLCPLVLLHPGVHHLEVASDSSWPPHLAAYAFFGYNVGNLAFLLAQSGLLVETAKENNRLEALLSPF